MLGNHAISAGLKVLAGILEREKARGGDSVAISPEAIAALQDLPSVTHGRRQALAAACVPVEVAAVVAPTVAVAAAGEPIHQIPAAVVKPAPVAEEGRDEAWRRAQLNTIFKSVKNAPEPKALGTLFETVVFASGNPSAEIVLVGEAPGAEEEKLKKPFVGPSGQKLEQILKAMGLSREEVYISNIVKFRPKKGDGRFQGSSNRPPTHEEMASCLPFIRAEIEVLCPRVIVALGRTAAEGLLEQGGALGAFRAGTHQFGGIPVVVTYHPSYLLRQEAASPEEGKIAKRQVWEDMLRVMEITGLPISEKQRNFFL
jgi:uracil-DNA glycosylase